MGVTSNKKCSFFIGDDFLINTIGPAGKEKVMISTSLLLFFYLIIQLDVHRSYPTEMVDEERRRRGGNVGPLEVPVASTGSPRRRRSGKPPKIVRHQHPRIIDLLE